eukprot:363423-Chlamydomonas_euryale.AAC.11
MLPMHLRLREQLPAGRPQQALIRHPQQAVAHRGCHDERDAHCPGRVSAATNEANAPVRQATNTAHDEASSHERNCGAAPAAERPPQQHGLRGGGAQLARCRAHHPAHGYRESRGRVHEQGTLMFMSSLEGLDREELATASTRCAKALVLGCGDGGHPGSKALPDPAAGMDAQRCACKDESPCVLTC